MTQIAEENSTPTIDANDLEFADLARLGKNDWWRYVLSVVLFFGLGFVLNVVFSGLIWLVTGISPESIILGSAIDYSTREGTIRGLALLSLLMGSLIAFLISARIVFPSLHARGWRTFLTSAERFQRPVFLRSFLVTFGVLSSLTLAQLVVFPGTLEFVLQPTAFLIFVPVVVFLTTFQVLAEEVVFRGYILQTVGLMTRIFAIRLAVPALLFAAAHGANQEIATGGLWAVAIYVSMGFYLTFLVLRSAGIEEATGFHLANNIFAFSVLGYAAGGFYFPTILFDPSTIIDVFDFAMVVGALGLHFLVLRSLERRNTTTPFHVSNAPQ